MPASAAAWTEVLESECLVDMDRLRDLCRRGIPPLFRADAWSYLLGVNPPEKAHELTHRTRMERHYLQLDTTGRATQSLGDDDTSLIQRTVRTFQGNGEPSSQVRTTQILERIISAHMQNSSVDFDTGIVALASPFAVLYNHSEVDAFHCFHEFMLALEWGLTFPGHKAMFVMFMTLLRYLLPELCDYFETIDWEFHWLESWLKFLLARELPQQTLFSLWDCYFAADTLSASVTASSMSTATASTLMVPKGSVQELHVYVCLAILENCQQELFELDSEDMLQYLRRLPQIEAWEIVSSAQDMRQACAIDIFS